MNLTKLFETQRVLDARIELEHPPVEGEDRFSKKILALQTELGELANELPEVFKFWSNKKNDYEKALKEYVDGLHFILSIGLELNISYKDYMFEGFQESSVVTHFMEITKHLLGIHFGDEDEWFYMFQQFIGLGEMLGFIWEQIEQAYYDKNAINHTRQNTGY